MAHLQQNQLKRLCSTPEVYEKAQSILRFASARTGPGSGFIVNPAFLPAACAYVASEQLNTNEVTLKSAAGSACVSQHEFSGIIKTVRTALGGASGANSHSQASAITYESLVDAYRVVPRDEAVAWMQDAEACLPSGELLRQRYGKNVVLCAVFYWVCQMMEHAVQAKQLCQTYGGVSLNAFKSIVKTLDGHCDSVADVIRSQLPQLRQSTGSTSTTTTSTTPMRHNPRFPNSPAKSPTKSAIKKIRTRAAKSQQDLFTPTTKHTPSPLKRTVSFPYDSVDEDADMDDASSFPETPTKRRRIEQSHSPNKAGGHPGGPSPSKYPREVVSGSTTAFHEALTRAGSSSSSSSRQQTTNENNGHANSHPPEGGDISSQEAGPSTPRRTHTYRAADVEPAALDDDMLSHPFPSISPSRPTGASTGQRRRRFLPVFIDQQQWLARDPRVERVWRDAEMHRDKMLVLYDHPFQRYRDGGRVMEVEGGC